ncbi:MAG: hypothetical protein IPJ41_04165 [Phycisphaerales bacterium]|nr:hypothetical protein [Phycisphaerales bacterium]
MNRRMKLTAAVLAALAGHAAAQVQHGQIDVNEIDCANTSSSIVLSIAGGTGDWTTVSNDGVDSSSRGDYFVDMGTGNDAGLGVLLSFVNETSRISANGCPLESPFYVTPASDRSGSGSNRYWIVVNEAPDGTEANYNVCFAYFPIADGWITGNFYNSANNGPLTSFVGNPLLTIRDENSYTGSGFEVVDYTTNNGIYAISLEGYDLRRDGVLLTSGAKNEDNRVATFVSYDGTAAMHCIDNGSESGGENDPAGFVFIPDGTAGVTMGYITGCGDMLYHQGAANVEILDPFGATPGAQMRITIPGESPATGTMLLCPRTELGGATIDNPVFCQPDGDGWIFETYDTEPLSNGGLALQSMGAYDAIFAFAFIPNDADIVPGTPAQAYKSRLGHAHAARIAVTEITPDNTNGSMIAERAMGSDALDSVGDNRGDCGMAFFDARHPSHLDNSLDAYEGVYLASSDEFLRDNSGTGGVSGWTTVSFDNGEMHAHNASLAGGEINSDFAVAYFPTEAGFTQDADVQVPGDVTYEQSVPGVAGVDGVIIAMNWDNNNRVVNAAPNGNSYTLSAFEGAGGAESLDWDFGYVWFPYSTPDLVAGQISAAGAKVSGAGSFSVSSGTDQTYGFPVTKIAISGVDARTDGVLMLCGTDGPYALSWEPGEDGSFEVAGFDLALENPGQTGFNFVYVPYEGLVAGAGCVADFNGDGAVNTQDFIAYLNAWVAKDARADIDGNGTVNTQDFIGFLNLWTVGC